MIKNLDDKIFKHYIDIKYYNIALDFARNLKSEKTLSIIFNKEFRILKEHLVQKNKKEVQINYIQYSILRDIFNLLIKKEQIK